ncbi:unnamed protein product, partial [Ascophyllum nodosum]
NYKRSAPRISSTDVRASTATHSRGSLRSWLIVPTQSLGMSAWLTKERCRRKIPMEGIGCIRTRRCWTTWLGELFFEGQQFSQQSGVYRGCVVYFQGSRPACVDSVPYVYVMLPCPLYPYSGSYPRYISSQIVAGLEGNLWQNQTYTFKADYFGNPSRKTPFILLNSFLFF